MAFCNMFGYRICFWYLSQQALTSIVAMSTHVHKYVAQFIWVRPSRKSSLEIICTSKLPKSDSSSLQIFIGKFQLMIKKWSLSLRKILLLWVCVCHCSFRSFSAILWHDNNFTYMTQALAKLSPDNGIVCCLLIVKSWVLSLW